MRLQDKINNIVADRTGFDIPELSAKARYSRHKILKALYNHQDWLDDYVLDLKSSIDKIIDDNFTSEERYKASKR